MTLSGNLGFVPLDEVLRLLTRSGNNGMVRITNAGTSGRIYVVNDGIGLATTMVETELHAHLVRSGFINAGEAEAVETGAKSISDVNASELTDLIREITVESIYQMNVEDAEFRVVKDEISPFAVSQPFDLESILKDSLARANRWEQVTSSISNLDAPLHINRVLNTDSVEVDKETWRLLSEMGSGASVSSLAIALGTTEFAVGRVAAQMADNGLIFVSEPVQETDLVEDYVSETSDESVAATEDVTEDVTEEDGEDLSTRSWWEEPEPESASVVSEDAEDETAQVEETLAEIGGVGDVVESEVSDAPSGELSDDDEDTEAFLEQVFSELEPETEESEDGGHGLMRRRRIGSILKDLDED